MGRGEDRISTLPNEILQVILCLMPLKHAIRTSTLSKRWRHLWQINLISSTSLQFGEDFSCNQSPKQFVTTLDWYLQLHGSRNLDKFEILFSPFTIFFPNLENWVATVLAKGVKQLEVNLSQGVLNYFTETYVDYRMPFVMPNSIFNTSSLTQLSLSRCNFSEPLDLTSFVGLCSLSLDLANLTDEMLTSILENCVSLETICLKRCEKLEVVKFVGDKLKLRKLVIVDCIDVSDIEISAPKLESFLYHGWIMFSLFLDNVTKVNDAYLCSGELYDYEQGFFNILSDFSHVKVLTICSMGLMNVVAEALEYDEAYIPLELHNLQELQIVLNSIWVEPIYCIFSFFHLCPSPFLEKLFIQLSNNFYHQHDQGSFVDTEKEAPDIVFQNLKWIKITNFGGTPLELKLARFFLEKAILLESIIFVFMNQCDISNNSLSLRIIKGQLSVIPKASKDANIVICGPLDHDCVINPTHTTFYHQEKYRNGTTVHLDYGSTRSEDIPLYQEFL